MSANGHPARSRRIPAADLAASLAAGIPVPNGSPVRVAIDGMTGVGKTTLRALVSHALREMGRDVAEASGDDFHHQRAVRYRQGRTSARGYYEDAYDYVALGDKLLRPLGPEGSRVVRLRHHDLESDAVLTDEPSVRLGDEVTVVVDGSFLQRPELDGLWDWVILVEASRAASAARQVVRDGAPADPDDPYHARYFGGYDVYVAQRDPASRAHVVVTNEG
ncbi:uridine kinase [Demequina sp.]|uniref:uridine kinase n=1 Tax=Demequina sp. TaxID=2050685 RepID=UPI003D152393